MELVDRNYIANGMNNYGRFGALLGTIYIGHTHCKYLVSILINQYLAKAFYRNNNIKGLCGP